MADLREDFIQYVVKALVNEPDAVALRRVTDEKGEYLELTVDPADMGKVIGKAGATAKSIRTLLRGVGAKDDLPPLPLKIVDPEGKDPGETVNNNVVADADDPTPPTTSETEPQDDLQERTKREMKELADFDI